MSITRRRLRRRHMTLDQIKRSQLYGGACMVTEVLTTGLGERIKYVESLESLQHFQDVVDNYLKPALIQQESLDLWKRKVAVRKVKKQPIERKK